MEAFLRDSIDEMAQEILAKPPVSEVRDNDTGATVSETLHPMNEMVEEHVVATSADAGRMESTDSLPIGEYAADGDDQLPKGLQVLFVDDESIFRKLFIRTVRKVAPT